MTYEKILYACTDGVARISLNQPATYNAVTEDMGHELVDAFDRAEHEARCVLLTAEGKAFCSGADLAAARAVLDDPRRDFGGQLERAFGPVILAMKRLEMPVVTAARGAAAGYGAALLAAGDVVLMADNAFLYFAFRHVGLVPDGGAAYLLSKAAGRVRAMQLMLLGEKLPAQTALEWGLATRVVPEAELDEAATTLARDLAAGPRSLGMIKRLAWDALESDLATSIMQERIAQRDAGRTEDFVEGVTAFGEKRAPRFSGR